MSSVARRLIAEVASKQRAAGLQPPRRVACGEGFPASLLRAAIRTPRDHPPLEDTTMARKQNPEQSVADVIAETGPPRARPFGINHFILMWNYDCST